MDEARYEQVKYIEKPEAGKYAVVRTIHTMTLCTRIQRESAYE